jgi:hypothetical protein
MSAILEANTYFTKGSGNVTLCGSTKFFAQCMEANRRLTFQNWIVLMCGSWGHSYHKDSNEQDRDYSSVKLLHFHKMLMSDVIVIVSDQTGYIGDSTKKEIAFCQEEKIPMFHFDGDVFSGSQRILRLPDRYTCTSFLDGVLD